ncbi:ribose 5-phosphate isomerase A [Dielma fastidiosa]|uniref:ribose 5-phosphate isomerase A n=1 Tax=Dielma fastidiosa TaxID=1034346 RepID=UPI00356988BF
MCENKWEALKQKAAQQGCMYIHDGMKVGLGSGSTMVYALKYLGERVKAGLRIQAVCSSDKTEALARELKLPMIEDPSKISLDINLDGVDQIDPQGNVIKGGGAALTREKMLAQWSAKTIWIMDERKIVDKLDQYLLPVEVLPFNHEHMRTVLITMGYQVTLRKHQGQPLITDNGGLIFDVRIPIGKTMSQAHQELIQLAGVVETGYFEKWLSTAVIAGSEGIKIIDFKDQ